MKPGRYDCMPTNGRACDYIAAHLPRYVLDRDRCGKPAIVGKPYCAEHMDRCYVAIDPKREPTESSKSGFVFYQGGRAR